MAKNINETSKELAKKVNKQREINLKNAVDAEAKAYEKTKDLGSNEVRDADKEVLKASRKLKKNRELMDKKGLSPKYDEHGNLVESQLHEISDKLADKVANIRKMNAIFAKDELEKLDAQHTAELVNVERNYTDKQIIAGDADAEIDAIDKKYEPAEDEQRQIIKKAEKNQVLMAKRARRKSIKNEALELPSRDTKFNYMMLSRMQMDCDYFIKNPCEKHLWAGSVDRQIELMNKLYDALPEKPEWLTREQLDNYETRMKEVLTKDESMNEISDDLANKVHDIRVENRDQAQADIDTTWGTYTQLSNEMLPDEQSAKLNHDFVQAINKLNADLNVAQDKLDKNNELMDKRKPSVTEMLEALNEVL